MLPLSNGGWRKNHAAGDNADQRARMLSSSAFTIWQNAPPMMTPTGYVHHVATRDKLFEFLMIMKKSFPQIKKNDFVEIIVA